MVRPNFPGPCVADIFDEIQEDLRAERAQAILKRYGIFLVAALILVVLGAAGWKAWNWRAQQNADAVASQFLAAMRLSAPTPAGPAAPAARQQAESDFAAIAATGPDGYRALARLREAALQASNDNLQGALTLWDQVSADTRVDPLLRGLADLMWVQHQVDAGDPAAIEGRLAQLVASDNPWRCLALESQALLAIRTGNAQRARDILRGLTADAQMPQGLRARAAGLLSRLGEPVDITQGAAG